jgi:competence protein ComEC
MLALYERAALFALPLIALLVTLGVTASSFCEELKGQWRIAALVSICVLASSLWIVFSLNRSIAEPVPIYVNTTGAVVESRPWGRSYAVAVSTPRGGFLLSMPPEALSEGDVIRVEGKTEPLSSDPDSDFREDRYWMARGIKARLTSFKTEPAEGGALPWSALNIHRWRHLLYLSIITNMPRLTGAYLNAVWTGKHDAMLDKAHRAWGTNHILAVSGFHVGIAMAGASLVIKRGRWRVPFLSLVLWFYVFLTGAPPSAVRAGLMIQVGLAGELAGRPGSSINSVSLAAVLLLLRSPFWFWDAGWRLSVLAALAIAVSMERWRSFGVRTWLFMNSMIWLATIPQVSWTFEGIPLAGLLINLVAPQFFGIAFSTASVVAAVSMLETPLTPLLISAVEGTFVLCGILADALANLIPWRFGWHPLTAYCCTALFIMFMCRSLYMPWRNVAILSPLGALTAYLLFAV